MNKLRQGFVKSCGRLASVIASCSNIIRNSFCLPQISLRSNQELDGKPSLSSANSSPAVDVSEPLLPHLEFRNSLRGQRVTIPNLYTLFPKWKPKLHQEYERARDDVLNPWLQFWVDDPHASAKLQAADFGVFAAIMCSEATFEKLCTVAKYFAWYFIWDDIFDCGSLRQDAEGIKAYRQKSIEYFQYTLCRSVKRPDLSSFTQELQKALLCWDEVGTHIRETCTEDVCQILLQQMVRYISSVDRVDSICLNDKIPSVDEYWQRRDLTAAVYPVIGTIPFIYGIGIFKTDVENKTMALVWKHTSYLVHITNDMFSMRKEARDNQIENLIPVLMLNQGLDCNEAMQKSFQLAEREARDFHRIEERLHQDQDEISRLVSEVFIKGCKNVAMGLIHWSYSGQRYFKKTEIDGQNMIHFQI